MSLRNRILIFFTLFGVVAFLAIFFSSRSTRVVGDAAYTMANHHLPMVHAMGAMESALLRQDDAAFRFLATRASKWKDEVEKQRVDFSRWFLEAQANANAPIERDRIREIDELYVQYENKLRQMILSGNAGASAVQRLMAESTDLLNQIHAEINQVESLRQGMTIVRQEQIDEMVKRHNRFTFYFLAVTLVFFGGLASYLWYFLVRPLDMLVDGIRNFTRGRLDVQIPPVGRDELGELQDAFNEMSREIAQERKRLKAESQSDPLTGLFNMRYFRIQLAEEFSRSQRYAHPLALLMLDVDHFKEYNDRNGHPAGDIVLKEVSRILIRSVRGTDIVARYGGEEFVILLPETALEAAEKVSDKIRKAVEEHHFPFQDQRGSGKLTVSIGVAAYPDVHVTSDQDLIEASDTALYQAKGNGRNRVMISRPSVEPRRATASDLPLAK